MRLFGLLFFGLIHVFSLSSVQASDQVTGISTFLPNKHRYNAEIVLPKSVLGFEIGDRHPRHDQILRYVTTLAEQSPRIKLTEIGTSYELRKQVLLTVSSEKNLANLDSLLAQRKARNFQAFSSASSENKTSEKQPVVVWLGYSIHGDEPSGSSAAMVLAYHLAASTEQAVAKMLDDTIIVIDPSMNPDGLDRFVTWVNAFRGSALNPDANHIEHHQGWFTGRTNHFGFDLNRDWLLLTQKESQNRIKFFHQYQPNVFGDFHEMAASKTYFFQPGIPSRTHPLTPLKNVELTEQLAKFHAKALDQKNRLYYSKENFDDFYYGKGSTYPDINGAVGILLEQAGVKGMQQQTQNGLLTFAFGIENHVAISLSTIEGSWQNRQQLNDYSQAFYRSAKQEAGDDNLSGYIVTEQEDPQRLALFLATLKQHQINAYPLMENFKLNEQTYRAKTSFFIPLEQPQYRLIKALFSQQKHFKDNTFYDVSGWTLPLAMNIHFEGVSSAWGLKTSTTPWQQSTIETITIDQDAYAYAFDWQHYLAPKLLNALLQQNIQARVATRSFTAVVKGKKQHFKAGSIVIPAGLKQPNNWRSLVSEYANHNQIPVTSLTTGLAASGVDVGSISLKPLKTPRLLLIAGKGVSEYEIAEMRYYLDEVIRIPLTIVEMSRLEEISLAEYSNIVMVNGRYHDMLSSVTNKLETWIANGGVIYAQKGAAKWLSEKDILKVSFISKNQIDQMYDTDYLNYANKEMLAARKRISGAIYASELDLTHPLSFGFNQVVLPLFKDSTFLINQVSQPFMSVAKYTQSPLMSGFTDKNLVNTIANNDAIVAHNLGKGRVIASSDNLAYRGYWHGATKLIANSLFFPKTFSVTLAE